MTLSAFTKSFVSWKPQPFQRVAGLSASGGDAGSAEEAEHEEEEQLGRPPTESWRRMARIRATDGVVSDMTAADTIAK